MGSRLIDTISDAKPDCENLTAHLVKPRHVDLIVKDPCEMETLYLGLSLFSSEPFTSTLLRDRVVALHQMSA